MKFPKISKSMSTEEKILWLIRKKSMTPTKLSKATGVTISTVSEHLRRLGGKVKFRKVGKNRVYYFAKKC